MPSINSLFNRLEGKTQEVLVESSSIPETTTLPIKLYFFPFYIGKRGIFTFYNQIKGGELSNHYTAIPVTFMPSVDLTLKDSIFRFILKEFNIPKEDVFVDLHDVSWNRVTNSFNVIFYGITNKTLGKFLMNLLDKSLQCAYFHDKIYQSIFNTRIKNNKNVVFFLGDEDHTWKDLHSIFCKLFDKVDSDLSNFRKTVSSSYKLEEKTSEERTGKGRPKKIVRITREEA